MLVQEEFPNLMDNESDKEDLDFEISSDDDSHASSESSKSISVIPPTPNKQKSQRPKVIADQRKITQGEDFNNERERLEENGYAKGEEDEGEGTDNEEEDKDKSL